MMITRRIARVATEPHRLVSRTQHRDYRTAIHTIFDPTPSVVKVHLESQGTDHESVAMYLIHPDLPRDIVEKILDLVGTLRPNSIGSYAYGATPGSTDTPSLSIATFTPSTALQDITTFRADIKSRLPVSVGKSTRKDPYKDSRGDIIGELERAMLSEGGNGWGCLWEGPRTQMEDVTELPEEMRNLENVQQMLLLSDGQPSSLLSTLSDRFPSASILGLLTAQTPFITGRPYTLVKNGETFQDGAVGIAFSDSDGASEGETNMTVERTWEGLEAMGGMEEVSDAEGNMLIRLSPPNSNPAQALIKALNSMPPSQSHNPIPSQAKSASAGISAGKLNKEEEFFMALWSEAGEAGSKRMIMNQVTRILSGDPSKGALSLEMTESLRVGQKVQFMRRSMSSSKSTSSSNRHGSDKILSFHTLPPSGDQLPPPRSPSGEAKVVDGIAVGTESGFFYGPGANGEASNGGASAASVCKVPGARGTMYLR